MTPIPPIFSLERQEAASERCYASGYRDNDSIDVNFCSDISNKKKPKICFLANKHLTFIYSNIAQDLANRGFDVVWISPSRRWSQWLLRNGWPCGQILSLADITRLGTGPSLEAARTELAELERGGDLRIADIILMDRVLRRRAPADGYRFLAGAQRAMRKFLVENEVDLCLGEATWAWELVASMVCRQIGRPCLAFTTVRVPSDRFALFDSASHQIIAHRGVTPVDRRWAEEFIETYRSRPRSPGYSRRPISALSLRKHWLRELAVGLLRPDLAVGDMTVWPLAERIRYRAVRAFNAALLRALPPFEQSADLPRDERYVLFCLHHQPEASIDVVAAAYSNQMATVERLARRLPATHRLWVKEHGSAVGDRSRGWLRRLARLPGVRLIDYRESSFDLIRRADLVVSPAGTVCLEAAMLGVPALTLADLFFAPLMATCDQAAAAKLDPSLRALCDLSACRAGSQSAAPSDPVGYLAWIHAQSFPGEPDRMAGEAMAGRVDTGNLRAVAEALEQFLSRLSSQEPASRIFGEIKHDLSR